MYNNKVLELVKKMKSEYNELFRNGSVDKYTYNFKEWIEILNDKTITDICSRLEINQFDKLVLFRYGDECFEGEEFWKKHSGIYRECRSVVIDLESVEIAILPFDKFFNVGELEETSIENISKKIENSYNFSVADKLDGSMQCLRYYKGKFLLTGARALSEENSWRIKEGKKMLTNNIKYLAKINPDITFIFEFIHKKDSKVVLYKEEGLYLIGARNVKDGQLYTYYELMVMARFYRIRCAEIENIKFDEILKKCKYIKGYEKEGWVLNIDGYLVKIKGDDYVGLHRLLGIASSYNFIIERMVEGNLDDVLSKFPNTYKNLMMDRVREINELLYIIKFQIYYNYNLAPKTRNEFYKFSKTCVPKHLTRFLNCEYENKEFSILTNRFGHPVKYKDLKKWSEA